MNTRFLLGTIRTSALAAALAFGCELLAGGQPSHAFWESARGNSANTGFVMVDTAPASWFSWSQMQPLGSIAPGANPVVGPSGDVYIGNLQGELRAFHADGTPYWTRQLNSLHGGIFAAPAIGADGSIYVVSTIHYTDHRDGVVNERNDSFLHKFTPGGGWLFAIPFPEQYSGLSTVANRGATTAPPNIWRWNGVEAVMVPVVYQGPGRKHLRLIAFSTSGAVLADQEVTSEVFDVTVGLDPVWFGQCMLLNFWNAWSACLIFGLITGEFPPPFTGNGSIPLEGTGLSLPGVAIRPDPQGGPPFVMVTDGRHDKVAYTFSPQGGFSEVARSEHTARRFTTPPVVLPNGDTVTGTLDGYLTRTGQNFVQLAAFFGLGTLTAAPTRLSDGALAVVSREGIMTVTRGAWRFWRKIELAGESIASAAASCNHIFVASTDAFTTFDARTVASVGSLPWTGGGLHAPVIGPEGHVYAIAADTLYVFRPPWRPIWDTRPPSCALLPPVLSQ